MKGILNAKIGAIRRSIPWDEIVFMEKKERKMTVHMMADEFSFYRKTSEVMSELDGRFSNPHCSYIINMDHITEIDKSCIKMSNGETVFIGRQSLAKARKDFDNYAQLSDLHKGGLS